MDYFALVFLYNPYLFILISTSNCFMYILGSLNVDPNAEISIKHICLPIFGPQIDAVPALSLMKP